MKNYRLIKLNSKDLDQITPKIFNEMINRDISLLIDNKLSTGDYELFGYDGNLAGTYSSFEDIFKAIDRMPMRKWEFKDLNQTTQEEILEEYQTFTNQIMPNFFKGRKDTKVKRHHSFQRVLLDNLFADVWYQHLKKPAYQHLNKNQLVTLNKLAQRILENPRRLELLNQYSLLWRDKLEKSLPPRAGFLLL